MPAVLVNDVVNSEIGGQTPWPENAQLFQPEQTYQILLPDNSNCLSVQAYLKMCNLKYEVVTKHNAENMSPSGKVPFLKCGAFLIPELEGVIAHVKSKEISLTDELTPVEKADMRVFMSLVNYVLVNAELFLTWVDPFTYEKVTWVRHASVYPWPLNYILTFAKKQRVIKRLKALQWHNKTLDEVYIEVETCCKALSDRLDKNEFYFGNKPTELDALVFGHLFTILTTPLPTNRFAGIVHGFSNLVHLCERIDNLYFRDDKGVKK